MIAKSEKIIKISSLAGLIACIGDFVALFVLGLYFPGYSQLKNTMSSLGAWSSPVSNEISTWWIFAGFLFIFFGIGLRHAFIAKGRNAKIASWLIILYGVGEEIGSGVFKNDHFGNGMIRIDIVHNILGGIGVLSLLLLPIVMKKVISKEQMPKFHVISTAVFIIGLTMLLLFSFRILNDKNNILSIYKGLWQRLSMLNNYIYLCTIAFIMLHKNHYITEDNN